MLALLCMTAGLAAADDNETGEPDFEAAWNLYHHRTHSKRWLRAGAEIGTYLGLGGAWYYANLKFNMLDWQYELNAEDLRLKFTEGIRFDNNPMRLNSPGHPATGAIIHGFARSNGFSELESLGIGAVCAFLWEFLVEYREVISINDMIVATSAGAALGEGMHQLGMFFARADGSRAHGLLSALFGAPTRLNALLDGKRPRATRTGRFGLPNDVWHQFDLWISGGSAGPSGRFEAGFDTQLLTAPTYGHAASASRVLTDTVYTRLKLRAALDSEGLAQVDAHAKATLVGYYAQDTRMESGELSGYSLIFGGATGFQHHAHRRQLGTLEQIAIAEIFGPTLDVTLHRNGVRLRAVADAYGDFGLVGSAALDEYEGRGNSLMGTKTILANQRYYFAYGLTASAQLVANYGPFEAGGEVQFHAFESIEGRDRVQSLVTDDFHLSDRLVTPSLWIACAHPDDVTRLALSVHQYRRRGSIHDVVVENVETTTLATVAFRF